MKIEEDRPIEALHTGAADEVLVARALSGGPEEFAPIIARYKDAVFGVSLARLRHFEDAEDIAQQAFIEAFERLHNLKDHRRLGAWLRSIAIHRSINHIKRKRRAVELDGVELVDGAPSPQEALERDELRSQVLTAIGRLSKVQRETVALYYISGYSQQEVAEVLEVPLGTVKHRLHAARVKLKEEMINMVEDVLKEEAPDESFAERVFELLSAFPTGGKVWSGELMNQIKAAGPAGRAGFVKAMSTPHWQTRRAAIHYAGAQRHYGGGVLPLEQSVALLKEALADSNLKVRQWAVWSLIWGVDVEEDYRCEHFVPLLVPLLFDASKKVRHQVAGMLSRPTRAARVPLETAARALAEERDAETIKRMQRLVQRVLDAQKENN